MKRTYYEVCDCDGEIFGYFYNEDEAVKYADEIFNENKDDFDINYCIRVSFVEEWFDEIDNRWRTSTNEIIHTALSEMFK